MLWLFMLTLGHSRVLWSRFYLAPGPVHGTAGARAGILLDLGTMSAVSGLFALGHSRTCRVTSAAFATTKLSEA